MDAPDRLEIAGRRAIYRPVGSVSLDEVVEMVATAIAYCREMGVSELLADISALSGFGAPDIGHRYFTAEKWARTARGGGFRLALVERPEMMDATRLGKAVAGNRGLVADVFLTEAEAEAWLDD